MFTSLSCFLFQIELLTLLFLNSLAEEAKAKAFEEKSATIRAQHLKAVSKVSPKRALIIKFAAVRAAFVTVNTQSTLNVQQLYNIVSKTFLHINKPYFN